MVFGLLRKICGIFGGDWWKRENLLKLLCGFFGGEPVSSEIVVAPHFLGTSGKRDPYFRSGYEYFMNNSRLDRSFNGRFDFVALGFPDQKNTLRSTLRIIGPSYGGTWTCRVRRVLASPNHQWLEIPWFFTKKLMHVLPPQKRKQVLLSLVENTVNLQSFF